MCCRIRCNNYVSGDDVRSVHELHHLNVLQLSVRRHDCEFDHAVRGSRMHRRYLRLSGSLQFR
jgi:hypothetical protein